MADFFKREEESDDAVQKITISGQEYDLNEIQSLVDIGKKTREAEEKYNTKLEKVWPEYGRSQNELRELRDKLKAMEETKPPTQTPPSEMDDVTRQAAIAEAKKLGLATAEDVAKAASEILDKNFRERYQQEREAERIYETSLKLQTDYNGADGRPKFDAAEMLEYMQATGIRNPEVAYKVKYEKELNEWQQKQFEDRRPRDFFTEESSQAGRSRSPQAPQVTENNLDDLVSQALYGDGETQ